MEVVPAKDDGAVHLVRYDATSKDTTTNRYFTSEGALLV